MPSMPKEFFIPQVRGKVRAYVVRGSEPLTKLVKYLSTMTRKYQIYPQEVQQIMDEVKCESVDPFQDPRKGALYQPQREWRYRELETALKRLSLM